MEESLLLKLIKRGDALAFSHLFMTYHKDLVLFASTFQLSQSDCEDIVQTLFLKLWNEREQLIIKTSLTSYLLKAVKNSCLDEIRHQAVVCQYSISTMKNFSLLEDLNTENYILYSDLSRHLETALYKLPPDCREAFVLNRLQGYKYKEVAEQLQISERTIEARIRKALSLLRKFLKEFLTLLSMLLVVK
ncbi:MAG: RNA polymerase sigma-70 factor [Tannerellaceae bacterium]|nr:RNA polymerase sigma-70 factor [Tannerellaceae bacterium]